MCVVSRRMRSAHLFGMRNRLPLLDAAIHGRAGCGPGHEGTRRPSWRGVERDGVALSVEETGVGFVCGNGARGACPGSMAWKGRGRRGLKLPQVKTVRTETRNGTASTSGLLRIGVTASVAYVTSSLKSTPTS